MNPFLLQSHLSDLAAENPDKAALVDENHSMTYRELHTGSNRVANLLKRNGVERQDRVLICMQRSHVFVMAIFAVLKADGIYVPVDPTSPASRLSRILADCTPSAILCDNSSLGVVNDLILACETRPKVVRVDEALEPADPAEPEYRNIDRDAAYILYTSGSTGTPKGVVVSHLNVCSYIDWAEGYFEMGASDRVLCTAPFHFDMSTFDIFATIKTGATLYIAPRNCLLFPKMLLDFIEKHEITLWKGVSSLLSYLAITGALKPERIPSIKRILFGGEVLPTKHLIAWMDAFPSKSFYNVYGPTEATGISACHFVERIPASPDVTVPIGRPCANTEMFVLTDDNRKAGIGESGELCIRGSGLSPGYWNNPELTGQAFVQNPFKKLPHDRIYRTGDLAAVQEEGSFVFLGRKDCQVKHMGYRIELFEIEKALLSCRHVANAAALVCESENLGTTELVAFIEADLTVSPDSVKAEISGLLPSYMIPRQIIPLKLFPRTDRGKTDREALRRCYGSLPGKQPAKCPA